jgi:cytochrome c553
VIGERLARGVLVLAVAGAGTAARAGDVQAGRLKAQACAVCHGPLGLAAAPDTPNLAGQPALYLSTQLRASRSGARRHEVMAVIAKPLTDEDITQLAAWFSAIRVDATAPSR